VQCGEIIKQFDPGLTKELANRPSTLAPYGHRPAGGKRLKLLELLERSGLRFRLGEREKYQIGLDLLAERNEV
jgi:hypothetical protein